MKSMIGMILIGLAIVGCDDNVVGASQPTTIVKHDTVFVKQVVEKPVVYDYPKNDTIISIMIKEVCYWAKLKSFPEDSMVFCHEEGTLSYLEFINKANTCKQDTAFSDIDKRFIPNRVHFVVTDTCMLHEVQIFK